MLAFFRDCDILFSVMRDRIELEEVFVSEESPVLVSCCGCNNENTSAKKRLTNGLIPIGSSATSANKKSKKVTFKA